MAGKKINKNRICVTCNRELKVGQRVTPSQVIKEVPEEDIEGLAFKMEFSSLRYSHLDCYFSAKVDGPQYDNEGNELPEYKPAKGYVKVQK